MTPGAYREIQSEIRSSNGVGWNERAEGRYWMCLGTKTAGLKVNEMEEGRKRVLGIIASILVARHLKTTEDLHDSRPSPRTESLVGISSAVGRANHEKDRRHIRKFRG